MSPKLLWSKAIQEWIDTDEFYLLVCDTIKQQDCKTEDDVKNLCDGISHYIAETIEAAKEAWVEVYIFEEDEE